MGKITDFLRKIGLLRSGTDSYKGEGQVMGDFYGAKKEETKDETEEEKKQVPSEEAPEEEVDMGGDTQESRRSIDDIIWK